MPWSKSSRFRKRRAHIGFDLQLQGGRSRLSHQLRFRFLVPNDAPRPRNWAMLKNNLLVLLVSNPMVYLWGFGPAPVLAAHGFPQWLGLFIGGLVSTQLLGWWFAGPSSRRSGGGWHRTPAGDRTSSAMRSSLCSTPSP